jgi:hypothetical protein
MPSGGVHPITLPLPEGGHVLDEFVVRYFTGGRNILEAPEPAHKRCGSPLVLADPDFDLVVDDAAPTGAESSAGAPSPACALFERLEDTREEAQRLSALLGVPPLLGKEETAHP